MSVEMVWRENFLSNTVTPLCVHHGASRHVTTRVVQIIRGTSSQGSKLRVGEGSQQHGPKSVNIVTQVNN